MSTTTTDVFDYIVAGGGHAGCVVASRLSEKFPRCTIALVEVGPNAHNDPLVQSSLGAPRLHGTDLQWNDMTAPQPGADNRSIYHGGGKLLSGGTGVNYGTWTRGHSECYNQWAKLVGDDRWSYDSLLPHFKRVENYRSMPEDGIDLGQRGFAGPMDVIDLPNYPLGPTLVEAINQAGHKLIPDMNSGNPLGVGRWQSNWRNKSGVYVRQPAGEIYDLSKVQVFTNTLIHKIILETNSTTSKPEATGIDIGNNRILHATKEVIVSCGSLRTPQLLMLSGLGPATHLQSQGITPILDLPDIGTNLHDHCSAMLFWKLRHPERGLAIGHPNFDHQGVAPGEFLLTGTIPTSSLTTALTRDNDPSPALHPHISSVRAHYETTFGYYPAGAAPGVLPEDGSIITTGIANWLPTSRGSITLRSPSASDPPIIDPQYLTTHHDRCILREAIRELMRIMATPAAQVEIEGQFQLPGTNITPDSTDEEIDERVRKTCITWFHPAGTAAMGKVVDTSCRVIGVEGLRVVDASILPLPIGAHYQAPIYAVSEQAVEIIASEAQ